MRNSSCKIALALVSVVGLASCADFLSGPGVSDTPNTATKLTLPGPLYVALQAAQTTQFEGFLARLATMWTQQVAGVSRQHIGYDLYIITANDVTAEWGQVYTGGGLTDVRRIQALAGALHDSTYIGVAKVWEALIMGEAASMWGDIPYREALDPVKFPQPHADPQASVYADVQAQLDSAINIYLNATSTATNIGPTGPIPGGTRNEELGYAGVSRSEIRRLYKQVAHTLKARFYMHMAELDGANYALALAQTVTGINVPAEDFLAFHSTASTEQNIWYQFQGVQRGDLGPGAAIINLMKSKNDQERLAFYFLTSADLGCTTADYFGNRPGANKSVPGGLPAGECSDFNSMYTPDLRQPLVTFAENKLIAAEAAYQVSGGGAAGQAAAQPYLDAERTTPNYGTTSFAALPSIPATLQNIMEEKYIALFLNIEVWNDFKRTCFPTLTPAPATTSSTIPQAVIPGRLPYGQDELNANKNLPQISDRFARNHNDPAACPIPSPLWAP